jgi:predicted RNA-binding protein with PIN domain
MTTLIDGYNLMHAAGIIGRGVGPGTLQRSRLALLNFVAESLDATEVRRTTVVFDAREAPPGLPRTLEHRGITVHFAPTPGDADALIEELIRSDSAPRRLTVVSSDHRLQRAARRRKSRAVDSDVWYAEVIRQRRERSASANVQEDRPAVPLLEEDVAYWIRQFGGESVLQEFLEKELARDASPSPHRHDSADESANDKPTPAEAAGLDDIFPPGYGEDLLEDD